VRATIIVLACAIAGPCFADEPVGCDKFKWPIEHERALLAKAISLPPDGTVSQPLAAAVKVPLAAIADAHLPMPPGRRPKTPDSNAGFVRYAALPRAATYRITISEAAWIDVVQDGKEIKSTAFSGALGCEGIRKSVKFNLAASPLVIEISGTNAREIAIAVTPD
jgi:hypothetical protein